MSLDEIEQEYIRRFFNNHISNNTPHGVFDVESMPTDTAAHDE